ncbi:MAG: hypothetical protein M3R36_18645 [Bacteroidota bacterium]|nr:hypothetical protein [Bacteroidota bacterium]
MKTQTFIFTVLILLFTISFLPENSESASKRSNYLQEEITSLNQNENGYTYVRVFKDGIWWIYVYDGVVLINVYPE